MLKRLPKWLKWCIYVLWFPWAFLRVAYYAWIRHETEEQLRRRFPAAETPGNGTESGNKARLGMDVSTDKDMRKTSKS